MSHRFPQEVKMILSHTGNDSHEPSETINSSDTKTETENQKTIPSIRPAGKGHTRNNRVKGVDYDCSFDFEYKKTPQS
jgi:hypothetical protein